jgi:sugar/nucleoside kinase (ribokinase family)
LRIVDRTSGAGRISIRNPKSEIRNSSGVQVRHLSAKSSPDVIVLGAPFMDTISVGGSTHTEPGGTILYASIAADLCGARVGVVGRWPEGALSPTLAALQGRCPDSAISVVSGYPGKARYDYDDALARVAASSTPGLETHISLDDIPSDWTSPRGVLVPGLGHPSQQLAFVRRLRAARAIPLIAVVFSPGAIAHDRPVAIETIRECDLAFVTLAEAYALADGDDAFDWLAANARWSVVDLGAAGAMLVTGGQRRAFRDGDLRAVDPTGRTDALAGAVTASLALGRPIESAMRFGALIAETAAADFGIRALAAAKSPHMPESEISPTAPSAPPQPSTSDDPFAISHPPRRVVPDFDRIRAVARVLAADTPKPFRFDTPDGFFPPVNHPRAIEYFFAVVLHQYGFWHLDGDRWDGFFRGTIQGVELKGSDFVWRSATLALLAGKGSLVEFLDDSGACPLPMLESHRELAADYAKFTAKYPPDRMLKDVNGEDFPLIALLKILEEVPGYREDPYRKKAMLLAMTLTNRPERFLNVRGAGSDMGWGPVVDYHIQRTALRTGLVVPLDEELRAKLNARTLLNAEEEDSIRRATFDAVEELANASGASHAGIDWLFFQARKRCPEVDPPDCPSCPLEPACGKQKKLFQPVFRTTYY